MKMNWSDLLDSFGRRLLIELGEDPDALPSDYNPITKALKESDFVERFKSLPGFYRQSLSRAVVICQMAVFDAHGGPEGDGEPKALRRHWYHYYKSAFAQPLALQLGDYKLNGQGVKEINDLAWTQRLSVTYGKLVDTGEITYRDLWVEDASRMMHKEWETLFQGCHIVIAVEKDSLFSDFVAPAKALGAKTVYSGKGKSSKAAIEKCLREHYGWTAEYCPFTAEQPLIILHISDYDFDGEAVIGPTFGEQSRRYTGHILEARVGIDPVHVTDAGEEWPERWYQVKVVNKGYRKWAERKALFLAECVDCGYHWPVVGVADFSNCLHIPHKCPVCGGVPVEVRVGTDTPHGFEVEALTTREYRGLLVDALLRVLPFEWIVERLRDECQADPYMAAQKVAEEIYEANPSYQALLAEFERLEEIKAEFENTVRSRFEGLGYPHVADWRDDDADPTPGQYREHVKGANDWSTPWRPFSQSKRTASLVDWLKDNEGDEIEGLIEQVIEW